MRHLVANLTSWTPPADPEDAATLVHPEELSVGSALIKINDNELSFASTLLPINAHFSFFNSTVCQIEIIFF